MHPGLSPSQGRTECSNVCTKRKILSCSRPPLFSRELFQSSLPPPPPGPLARLICSNPPWGLNKHHKGPPNHPLALRGDYTMRSQNAKWLLLSSSLCNQRGKYSPDVALSSGPSPVLCTGQQCLSCHPHTSQQTSAPSSVKSCA